MKSKKIYIALPVLVTMSLAVFLTLFPAGSVSKASATATFGNATAADVLSGKTATVDAGQVTGTMPNQGAYTSSVSTAVGGGTLFTRIPQGAYLTNTSGGYPEITTSVPDLVSSNILGGKNILGVAGGIANQPGTYNVTWYWPDGNGALNQFIPYGAYLTDSGSGSGTPNIRAYDPNFIASNIISGKSIFGVTGTATADANATAAQIMSGYTAYVNSAKITGTANVTASGSGTTSGSYVSVSGLSFRPSVVIITVNGGTYLYGGGTLTYKVGLSGAYSGSADSVGTGFFNVYCGSSAGCPYTYTAIKLY